LYFDAFSGVAGDMTIAALLDLGVPLLVVERTLSALPIEGFHLHRGHAHKNAIVATSFEVHLEAEQPLRHYREIDEMLKASLLPSQVKDLTHRIFRTLAESETMVHQIPVADVHFHEVGAVDAIVDIVDSAAALVYLEAKVVCSPLPMGHGFINAAHGAAQPATGRRALPEGHTPYAADVRAGDTHRRARGDGRGELRALAGDVA
jgi:hypothetical protein